MRSSGKLHLAGTALALVFAATDAHADPPPGSPVGPPEAAPEKDQKPAWYTAPPKRRAGVVVGLTFGLEMAAASAYPNKADQIGNPAFLQASGLTIGGGGGFTLMGALADFLNVGGFFTTASGSNETYRSSSAGFGLRIEAFPLYALVPSLRDLALFTQFGFGVATLEAKDQSVEAAKVMQSFASIGAFHEWTVARFLGGHLALGPTGELDVAFGQSGTRTGFVLGPRVAFYGGI